MNVIISNQQDNILNQLNIEVIKSIQGEFEVDDIINSFSNFFFSRMIIDVTAIKNYTSVTTYQKLSIGLPVDKIILLVPSNTMVSQPAFLSKLISMGYYNFTTNLEGINYLLNTPNTYRDVASIHQIDEPTPVASTPVSGMVGGRRVVLGIKNITEHAGATTLIYTLYKELVDRYRVNAVAIEVGKRDFSYFNDDRLISTTKAEISKLILKNQACDVILVDLNDSEADLCNEVLYLVEPSVIMMNKLMKKDRFIFDKIRGSRIVLNKCLLSKSDIRIFEKETGTKLTYVMPPINDRVRTTATEELLKTLGLV